MSQFMRKYGVESILLLALAILFAGIAIVAVTAP